MLTVALLDKTNFLQHPCYLPIDDSVASIQTTRILVLSNIVKTYQETILRKLLGHAEYYKMISDFTDGETSPNTQKWIDFIDGDYTYDVDGLTVQWQGAKNMLRYFIYYYFRKEYMSIWTNSGEVVTDAQNGIVINPRSKMVSNYNLGVDLYGNAKSDCYAPNAYNFLYKRYETDFVDWKFEEIKKITLFN